MNPTFRRYLPHAAAVVIFAIVTLIYFRPLLSGKELRQDDIARHKGMSKEIADYRATHHEEPLWTNSMFGGMPAFQISTLYPGNWLNLLDPLFKLYLPHPGGYLFLYCLGFFILLLCLDVSPWLSLVGALAYGFSSYFLIIIEAGHNSKANALGYLPAMIGGIVLLFRGRTWMGLSVTALFTAMELNANHVQISYYGYILVAFIVLGYFVDALRKRQFGHFMKALLFFILATLVGVLPNAGNLLTTNEYGKFTTRGKSELTIKSTLKGEGGLEREGVNGTLAPDDARKEQYERNKTTGLDADYATQWSYGIGETFTFLIPDFKGGASTSIRNADPNSLKKVNPEFREQVGGGSAYFGDQPFTSGPVYIGAIVVFLALIGLVVVRRPIKWPLVLATVLTTALAWGSNFMPLTDFFMHHVPGYNKFRAVAMILVVAEITLPLLAVLAVDELLKLKSWDAPVPIGKRTFTVRRVVLGAVIVTAGFCLIGYLAPDVVNSFAGKLEEEKMNSQALQSGMSPDEARQIIGQLMPQLEVARKAIFRSDALRSLIFVLLGAGTLWLYFTRRIKQELFLASLGLFIVIDLWTVDTRYLNARSFITREQNEQSITEKTAADEEILQDTALDYRVLNLTVSTWNDAQTSYYHKSVGGYHGAKLKKYDELIDFHLKKEVNRFYDQARAAFSSDSATRALLSKLQVINMLNTRYLILPGNERNPELPLKNPEANGNAWFVKSVIPVPDADDEIIGLGRINTKHEAVVQEKFRTDVKFKTSYPAEGTIRLDSYAPNKLVYSTNTGTDEFAVFSEIYYPKGWDAYVDGQKQPYVCVDYVLRGMPVPAGKHRVEFRFEPRTYATGNKIALAGSIIMVLTVAVGFYLHRRNNLILR